MNASVDGTGFLLPGRKSRQLEMTWRMDVFTAMLDYGVETSLQADGAVRKASVISACKSWVFPV